MSRGKAEEQKQKPKSTRWNRNEALPLLKESCKFLKNLLTNFLKNAIITNVKIKQTNKRKEV